MEKLRARFQASLSTKVLLPVVGVMLLLVAITTWMVTRSFSQQAEADAGHNLATADAVFRNSQQLLTKNLVQRFMNLRNEPRYKAVLRSGHLPTVRDEFDNIPEEQGVDFAMMTSADGQLLFTATRDPLLSRAEVEAASAAVVAQSLRGQETVDTIRVGERLFEVVSIRVTGSDGELMGALTFGSEIGAATAQEFSRVTQCEFVLLANGRVVATTLPGAAANQELATMFGELSSADDEGSDKMRRVVLGGEHYFCSAGKFPSLSNENKLGYLLLSSYEQPLRALRERQQAMLLPSGVGILLGSLLVWWVIRRVTQPLRELRDSVEAVGKGDYSQKVEIASTDECAELACVFNQMTENIKRSREELEQTVQTLKTTQAHLVQSEKLSGIGEFVAGVAHELNNPLTSVMGFSELLEQSNSDPQHKRYLEMIRKSAQRCHKIVQSLLSFARRHQPERKLISVNELVTGAVEFLQYQLRTSNIEVTMDLNPSLPRTMVDPHQLQQVFLNIVNNARQAIEGTQRKGSIRIKSDNHEGMIRVTFKDDGPGIPEKSLSKVFDPFFTTKEVGKGTGLGLSLCYGIVQEHGGSIKVESKPGEGAMFIVELPQISGPETKEVVRDTAFITAKKGHAGDGKKVLVIDDEETILQVVSETLAQEGYQVDVVRDGEAALQRLGETQYDLALCDWKMPGLNGQQVYERLRVSNPAMSERLIFFTGDVVNPRTQQFLEERGKVCLTKPFSLNDFKSAVRRALRQGETPAAVAKN